MGTGSLHGAQVLLPVFVALTVSAFALAPETAWACSGPPYDVNRADVIAEGWVERVEIGPEPAGFGSFHPVQVTMRVVRSSSPTTAATSRILAAARTASGPGAAARAASWTPIRPASTR